MSLIKPDELLFKDLTPGVSGLSDVRRQAGKPDFVWQNEDGSQQLEYPRGPNGTETYRVDIDAQGKFVGVTQILTAGNFARVHVGMTKDEVRRLLGRPGIVAAYALKHEEVWSWRWASGGYPDEEMFDVHFSRDGTVVGTSRSDVPNREHR
ncbi:outer membrane protein assembly factor BamE [Trinickia caryophylli]|uniref:outer membrane protein assembly factor BamE domain-containing protein n=1 Tax=Trinickia caryophylli TaxID=28094 RepID=UPI002E10ED74|nr:outer membrane protein assembly factor BamE [Trinickia caryophylli]WQE10241.1 outer membrane protein assembly factor BamE [Trinickia caryophylli]